MNTSSEPAHHVTAAADAARAALACLDLTSLNERDNENTVAALCARANALPGRWGGLRVAAVCVWPRFARAARRELDGAVKVAAVASFPHGGTDIAAALRDVDAIAHAGAHEVDVVLPYRALLAGDDAAAAALLRAVRHACQGLTLKVILETGELREPAAIERAARLALAEGADFLKTSTGKTAIGATLPAARAMLRAIAGDARATAHVGFKAAGGIRRLADALPYLDAVRGTLGADAQTPVRLRLGASALLDDIESVLREAQATR